MTSRTQDEQILRMMALRDHGLSSAKIAMCMGLTKGKVCGALFRVDREFAASEASA